MLFVMLAVLVGAIAACGWKMHKSFGLIMILRFVQASLPYTSPHAMIESIRSIDNWFDNLIIVQLRRLLRDQRDAGKRHDRLPPQDVLMQSIPVNTVPLPYTHHSENPVLPKLDFYILISEYILILMIIPLDIVFFCATINQILIFKKK